MNSDARSAHIFANIPYGQEIDSYRTILDVVTARAEETPDQRYLTIIAADGTHEHLTYGLLEARSAATATWLRDRGVTKGDVAGVVPTNDILSIVTIFGVLRTGATALIMGPNDPASRILEQTQRLSARIILRSPYTSLDPALPAEVAMPEPEPGTWSEAPPGPTADALMLSTSGSTAAAKIVVQSHHNVMANAEAVRRHHGLEAGQRLMSLLPVHHANALNLAIFGAMFSGAHAILPHGFDPLRAGSWIEEFRPKLVSVAPTILDALLQTWRSPRVPAELKYFLSAAAPLTGDTAAVIRERWQVPVLQGYGLTETTNFSTTMPRDLSPETYHAVTTAAPVPSIGVALHGNEVAVLSEQGAPVGERVIGEICVRGHNVMDRYAKNPRATAEAFRNGWFHTGDLGYAEVHDGLEFFFITGRSKNIAKVRGEMVSLEEVERLLRAVPGVRDAACVCRSDRLMGERVSALVSFIDGPVDVLTPLRDQLAPTAVPADVVAVDHVPRSATGKLLRPKITQELERRLAVDGQPGADDPSLIGTLDSTNDRELASLRNRLLEARNTLPTLPPVPIEGAGLPQVVAELSAQLARQGVAVAAMGEPLNADGFIELGQAIGRPVPERDPAVQPYVEQELILNLLMGRTAAEDPSLQPFGAGPLTLHSEGSGRPLSQQFRHIVLMCRERGGDDREFQTILVPMAEVAQELTERQMEILLHTRYCGQPEAPTIARRVRDRVIFAFRDFDGAPLTWTCHLPGATKAEVNQALTALLHAMYATAGVVCVTWRRGQIVVLDNTWFFHGRTSGQYQSGVRRHLTRLRLLDH